MIYVVDTHALTRYVERFPKLGAAGREIFDRFEGLLYVPTIALAEAQAMVFANKVRVAWDDITRTVAADGRFIVFPLTLDVLQLVTDNLEMHDGIVVASALLLQEILDDEVTIITRDRQIRDSGLVQTIW